MCSGTGFELNQHEHLQIFLCAECLLCTAAAMCTAESMQTAYGSAQAHPASQPGVVTPATAACAQLQRKCQCLHLRLPCMHECPTSGKSMPFVTLRIHLELRSTMCADLLRLPHLLLLRLIHHVNADGRVNVFYSTPAAYVAAKASYSNTSWPVKADDFFPYADCPHCYWTGEAVLLILLTLLSAWLQKHMYLLLLSCCARPCHNSSQSDVLLR